MTTVWDSGNKSASITLSRNDVVAYSSGGSGAWKAVRGTTSKSTGKWYLEYQIGLENNNGIIIGFGNSSLNTASYVGSDTNSFGYQVEGSTYQIAGGWQNVTKMGECIQICIDLDNKLIWARTDRSTNWNNSGTANPATGTGGKSYTVTGAQFPACSLNGVAGNTDQNAVAINAGGFFMSGSIPSGFAAWDTGVPSSTGISGTRPTTWDSGNKNANVVLSGSNLVATQSGLSNNWCGVRSLTSYDAGLLYFEATITATSTNGWEIGLQDSTTSLANGTGPGSDTHSIAFRNGTNDIYYGNLSNQGSLTWNGGSATQVIGVAVDVGRGLAWAKNVTTGSNWNNDASSSPVTGIRGQWIGSGGAFFIGWAGNRASGTNDVVTLNTGATSFTGSIPSGFSAWDGSAPQTLTPSLFTNTQTFFAPTVHATRVLTPSLFTDGDTFYSATVTRGSVALLPSLLTDGDTFFSPTVNASYVLTPSLFTDSDTFYSPTITQTGGAISNGFVSIILS